MRICFLKRVVIPPAAHHNHRESQDPDEMLIDGHKTFKKYIFYFVTLKNQPD